MTDEVTVHTMLVKANESGEHAETFHDGTDAI
jgi:hypothetical protein